VEKEPLSVENMILALRGQKVILDSDLARVYGVPTKRLNEQVRRNKERFPSDFMFQLTVQEAANLKSQIATSSLVSEKGHGATLMRSQIATASKRNARHRSWAFTEHGAIMAANVLNSSQAVRMSVFVVRAFVRLRETLTLHKDLARRLEELERKYNTHDHEFKVVFDAIRELMKTPEKPKRKIGFLEEPKAAYK